MSLPHVDTHQLGIAAAPETVWQALEEYVEAALRPGTASVGRRAFTRLLGTRPREGFTIAESSPPYRLVLTGRHRFSVYRLTFEVTPQGEGSRLRAVTDADFPGPHGRAYRALVIGSTAHERLTRRILQRIAARALTRR